MDGWLADIFIQHQFLFGTAAEESTWSQECNALETDETR